MSTTRIILALSATLVLTGCWKDDMADGAQKDCVRLFAFLKRALRPFHFVFGVIVTAAGNFFDLEIDLKHMTGRLQNVQSTR